MRITSRLWRKLTGPDAHDLTATDAAVVVTFIDDGSSVASIGLVLRVHHSQLSEPFDVLVRCSPAIANQLVDQLSAATRFPPSSPS